MMTGWDRLLVRLDIKNFQMKEEMSILHLRQERALRYPNLTSTRLIMLMTRLTNSREMT
jgi:hypothetical protein